MPIQINLLAESQAAEEQRRKDPVKRVLFGAGFIVCLVLLWGISLQIKLVARSSELSGLNTQWKSIAQEYQQVVDKQRNAIEAEGRLAALDRLTTNRFLWGSTLNALQQSMTSIDGVEVLRLVTEQNYVTQEEKAPGGQGQTVATSTERINMTVDASDYGSQPGSQVSRFKDAVANVPFFRDRLQKTNGVRLMTLSPPQTGAAYGGAPFVKFSLQCSFPETVR